MIFLCKVIMFEEQTYGFLYKVVMFEHSWNLKINKNINNGSYFFIFLCL